MPVISLLNQFKQDYGFDLSTAAYTNKSYFFQEIIHSQSLFFKPDGTEFYVIGDTSDSIRQYSLSVAWDLSTATMRSVLIH